MESFNMPREKEGYREMLALLCAKHPMLMSKKEACPILGISIPHLNKLIAQDKITYDNGKIPIGSIAKYLCG